MSPLDPDTQMRQGDDVVDRDGRQLGRLAGFVADVRDPKATHLVVQRDSGTAVVSTRHVERHDAGSTVLQLAEGELDTLPTLAAPPDTGISGLVAEDPSDVGLARVVLDITKSEPEHLLANEARADLRAAGFTDDEIDHWAQSFMDGHAGGDEADLVAWIDTEEHRG